MFFKSGIPQLGAAELVVAPKSVCISDALLDCPCVLSYSVQALSQLQPALDHVLQGLGILMAQCEQSLTGQ